MSCRLTAQSNLHNWSSSLIAPTSCCLAHLNVKKEKGKRRKNEKWNCSIAIQIINERGLEASHDNLISDWHQRGIFIRLRRRHRASLLKGKLHASTSYMKRLRMRRAISYEMKYKKLYMKFFLSHALTRYWQFVVKSRKSPPTRHISNSDRQFWISIFFLQ